MCLIARRSVGPSPPGKTGLAPRDQALAALHLPLGLIVGVAVGLFFQPAALAPQVSSVSSLLVMLASWIAFIAGYLSKGFFRMVGVITRYLIPGPDKGPMFAKPTPAVASWLMHRWRACLPDAAWKIVFLIGTDFFRDASPHRGFQAARPFIASRPP
jgi:hypothetical protein